MQAAAAIERELEDRVEDLGFEVVDVRWGGTAQRPVLKLRIDRPDSSIGDGVTVDDCATVSRTLEKWLDEHDDLAVRYVLEVSSPGVERPLVRARDFERFRGQAVVVAGREALRGGDHRLEGELLGLEIEGTGSELVRIRLDDGEEVDVPRENVRKIHLAFTWK